MITDNYLKERKVALYQGDKRILNKPDDEKYPINNTFIPIEHNLLSDDSYSIYNITYKVIWIK